MGILGWMSALFEVVKIVTPVARRAIRNQKLRNQLKEARDAIENKKGDDISVIVHDINSAGV